MRKRSFLLIVIILISFQISIQPINAKRDTNFDKALAYNQYFSVYNDVEILNGNDIIHWSFTGSNKLVSLTVYVMNQYNYSQWTSGNSAQVYTLSDNFDYTDYGSWYVPYQDTWYIVFWNHDSDQQSTTESISVSYQFDYDVNFDITNSLIIENYVGVSNLNVTASSWLIIRNSNNKILGYKYIPTGFYNDSTVLIDYKDRTATLKVQIALDSGIIGSFQPYGDTFTKLEKNLPINLNYNDATNYYDSFYSTVYVWPDQNYDQNSYDFYEINVFSREDSWVVIHNRTSTGSLGSILGYTSVPFGTYTVDVNIGILLPNQTSLYAVLYQDKHNIGVFEPNYDVPYNLSYDAYKFPFKIYYCHTLGGITLHAAHGPLSNPYFMPNTNTVSTVITDTTNSQTSSTTNTNTNNQVEANPISNNNNINNSDSSKSASFDTFYLVISFWMVLSAFSVNKKRKKQN